MTGLPFVVGFVAAGLVALAGWRARALSLSGALATVVVGTVVFAAGGVGWALVLIGFFVLSSGLSRLGRARKAAMDDVAAKGSRRDAAQVLANGGLATVAALLAIWPFGPGQMLPLFVGALAAVTADTWSTEIGGLSRSAPRSILSGRVVPVGTSGGVTRLGWLGAAAGGLAIGLLALPAAGGLWAVGLGVVAGGLGSLVDSLLGATVQRVYRCDVCGLETERTVHRCGAPTVPVRGVGWVDNDVVNLAASLTGFVVGVGYLALGSV